jgi:imidazolonepropionase-like amidohydrolase
MHRSPLSLLLALAAACGAAPRVADGPPPADSSFAITNVAVFDGERALGRTNVVVRAGRVAAIGTTAPPPGLTVIDGTGRTLLPGLIDAHAHVSSDAGLHEALQFGVTTLLDMFTDVGFVRSHRAQRDLLARTELADLYSAGAPVTSEGGMGTQFGFPFPTIAGPDEAPAFVRARLAEGSAFIKILYEPDAGIVTTISAATLAAVVTAARAQGAITAVHITSLAGAHAVADAGADGLAHIFSDRATDDALIAKLVARHLFVTPTISAHAYLGGRGLGPALAADPRLAPWLTAGQRKQLLDPPPGKDDPMAPYLVRFDLARAIDNVRRIHAAGVPILAGDDAASFGVIGVALHGELELLTRAGLTPAEALTAATLAPARAFRLVDRGRIAPGARADLVLVDGDPLTDITATRAIVQIFKNGYAVPRARR